MIHCRLDEIPVVEHVGCREANSPPAGLPRLDVPLSVLNEGLSARVVLEPVHLDEQTRRSARKSTRPTSAICTCCSTSDPARSSLCRAIDSTPDSDPGFASAATRRCRRAHAGRSVARQDQWSTPCRAPSRGRRQLSPDRRTRRHVLRRQSASESRQQSSVSSPSIPVQTDGIPGDRLPQTRRVGRDPDVKRLRSRPAHSPYERAADTHDKRPPIATADTPSSSADGAPVVAPVEYARRTPARDRQESSADVTPDPTSCARGGDAAEAVKSAR